MTRQLVRDAIFPETPGVYVVYEPSPPDERPLYVGVAATQTLWEHASRLDACSGALVMFAAATGLRPGEWIALEQRDIDPVARVVCVRRAYRNGRLKCTKTEVSVRAVCGVRKLGSACNSCNPTVSAGVRSSLRSPHGKIAFGGEPAVPGADARRRLDAPVRAYP